MKFKIITDSSSDMIDYNIVPFAVAPLKIITTQNEYKDDKNLNVNGMISDLLKYKGKSSTSCPNTQDWLTAFEDAEYIFCVTITASLSGCYNAAYVAKQIYEEKFSSRHVCVINSLSTGPEIKLIIEKIGQLITQGKTYEEICNQIKLYKNQTGLIFVLSSMKNLANNGRVCPLVAKAVGLLGIRVIGKASNKGELQSLDKVRGEIKTKVSLLNHLHKEGYWGGKIRISHCQNYEFATSIKEALVKEFGTIDVEIYECRGLCSFYAEKGGVLIGFEKE